MRIARRRTLGAIEFAGFLSGPGRAAVSKKWGAPPKYLGGVTGAVVPDQLKTGVTRACRDWRERTDTYGRVGISERLVRRDKPAH